MISSVVHALLGRASTYTWEQVVGMFVGMSGAKMTTKPILFWPGPRSDIELQLDRDAGDFLVVNTNSVFELQKLYKLHSETPIFDPFPQHGEHYQDFIDHVAASDCRCHIVGLATCQDVLQSQKDPLLTRSPIEEIFAAVRPSGGSYNAYSRHVDTATDRRPLGPFRRRSITRRGIKLPIDWTYLNWINTSLLAIFVFLTTLVANVLFLGNGLLVASVATFLFAALYVGIRADLSKLFSLMAGQSRRTAKKQFIAPPKLMRSWLKR
jgi:hypothetical protein